jgi:hypothetical protein
MGNWRTVHVTGTMSADHAAALRRLLDLGDYTQMPDGYLDGLDVYCLAFSTVRPGLCGLGDWPAERMDRSGNLHERDYTVADVHRALEALVRIAPSMLLKVHCGGEYESDECVATISVGEGLVVTGPPEAGKIAGPPEEQMLANLRANLLR